MSKQIEYLLKSLLAKVDSIGERGNFFKTEVIHSFIYRTFERSDGTLAKKIDFYPPNYSGKVLRKAFSVYVDTPKDVSWYSYWCQRDLDALTPIYADQPLSRRRSSAYLNEEIILPNRFKVALTIPDTETKEATKPIYNTWEWLVAPADSDGGETKEVKKDDVKSSMYDVIKSKFPNKEHDPEGLDKLAVEIAEAYTSHIKDVRVAKNVLGWLFGKRVNGEWVSFYVPEIHDQYMSAVGAWDREVNRLLITDMSEGEAKKQAVSEAVECMSDCLGYFKDE